jgi:hypothetical protein
MVQTRVIVEVVDFDSGKVLDMALTLDKAQAVIQLFRKQGRRCYSRYAHQVVNS